MDIYLFRAQKPLQKPTKRKLKMPEKLSGNDDKTQVRLGTKLPFQNDILFCQMAL